MKSSAGMFALCFVSGFGAFYLLDHDSTLSLSLKLSLLIMFAAISILLVYLEVQQQKIVERMRELEEKMAGKR